MKREILLFFICYVIVLIIYEMFIVIPMKKYKSGKIRKSKLKKEKSDPVEIKYLIFKYGLDIDKVNYNQLLRIISLVSSFDITIVVSIISLVDEYILQMLLAILLVIPIFFFFYVFFFFFF